MVQVGGLAPESTLGNAVVVGALGLDAAEAIRAGVGAAAPNAWSSL
jgi:hypothetical protein